MKNTIETFLSYIHCVCPIDYTLYDEEEIIISSNGHHNYLNSVLCKEHLPILKENKDTLVILGEPLGISWAGIQYNHQYHVFGPVIEQLVSKSEMHPSMINAPYALQKEFATIVEQIPVVSSNIFMDYALMFYYAVTGEKTNVNKVMFESNFNEENITLDTEETEENLKNCWFCEQSFYDAVEKGRSKDIRKIVSQFHKISLRKLYPKNTIRNKKNLSLFSLALCVRASVHGGLPVTTAYALEAHYTKLIENANSMSALSSVNLRIFDDYANRVHNLKLQKSSQSPFLIDVEEYIVLNIEKAMDLKSIAVEFNYTPYYLSRKYKEEKGMTIHTFIKAEKLKRACFLLANTDKSVSQISEQLHFGSVSYFIAEFRKKYQMTPAAFRAQRGSD